MASSGAHQEIGRLRNQVEYLSGEVQTVRQEREVLDHANHGLHRDLAEAKSDLRRSEEERGRLEERVEAQEAELKKLSEQIARLQRTAPPPSSSQGNMSLSLWRRQSVPENERPIELTQTPAKYAERSTPETNPQRGREGPTRQSSRASAHQRGRRVETSPAAFGRKPGTSSGSPTPLPHRPPPPQRQESGQVALISRQASDPPRHTNIVGEFSPFFNATEAWARSYCNEPSKSRDHALPSSLRERISELTNPSQAMSLLASRSTRLFAVTRLLNEDLVKTCFRVSVASGFRADFDNRLNGLKMGNASNIPIQTRMAIFTARSHFAQEMKNMDGYRQWLDKVINDQSSRTWQTVEPLFARDIPRERAWNELKLLWSKAYDIGLLMLEIRSLFHSDFPPIGPQSRFNAGQMISRDPDAEFSGQSQTDLGRMELKIRLAFTPVINEIDFSGRSATVMPKCVHFANVLVEK